MTITTLLAVIAFPFVLPFIVSAVLWRKLDRRWLFLVVSFLCLASIDEMSFEGVWALLEPTVSTKGTANAVDALTAYSHMRIVSLLIADAVVVVIGLPLLYWLFTALRRRSEFMVPVL
jgi:hypothetical protein